MSSAGVESQYAFYNADSGADCAVYWDLKRLNNGLSPFSTTTPGSISCGGVTVTTGSQTVNTVPSQLSSVGGGGKTNPTSIFQLNYPKGCAIVSVTKRDDGYTVVDSRGYNNCTVSAIKRYERGVTLTYLGDENTITGTTGNSTNIGHISLSTALLTFTSTAGVAPASQNFNITNSGTAAMDLSLSTTPANTYCHVTNPTSPLNPGINTAITVTMDSQSSSGSFPCTITVSSTNADNSSPSVDVGYTTSGIALRSSSNATVTTGSVVVSKPAGTVSGDVMIATIGVRPLAAVVTTPAGWAPLRRVDGVSSSLLTYWKVAGGSEPASYTWTVDASTGMVGGIMSFTGVDTTSIPVNIDGGQVAMAGTSSVTAPSVTTTVPNAMLITTYSINSTANWTPPSGMTEVYDIKSVAYDGVATNGVSLSANYALQSSSGASGAKVSTNNSVDMDAGGAQTIALHPAGTVGTNYALNKTVTAISTPNPNPSYNSGPVSNLTDGNLGTQAYNGTSDQYYSINLGSLMSLSMIKVYMSLYGYSNPYVYTTSWRIEGMNGAGAWVSISSGVTTPKSGVLYGYPSVPISQIRVKAESSAGEWLGILEVLAY